MSRSLGVLRTRKPKTRRPGQAPPGPIAVPRTLPRGLNSLPRNIVLLSQRGRLIEATARAVAEKGFHATTLADITGIARVSRNSFYEQFKDKENCFSACYEEQARLAYDRVLAAGQSAKTLPAQLCAALRTYLEVLAAEPYYALAFVVEVAAAGPRLVQQRSHVLRRYLRLAQDFYERIRQERPEMPELPEAVFEQLTAGASEVVTERIRQGKTAELPALLPSLAYSYFAQLGLQSLARRAITASPEALMELDWAEASTQR